MSQSEEVKETDYFSEDVVLLYGDCLSRLKDLPENSVDSLVTDPPAGIAFMNKKWDTNKGGRDQWIKWLAEIMCECHRVLKPGAHGFVWAIPRTSHWTATALENAGFEIRDVVTHLFGSGFPKSLNISKALDKEAGAEKVIGTKPDRWTGKGNTLNFSTDRPQSKVKITAPSTKAAKQWDGWGTALKPASEHWILIRKPCSEKTVAKNVLKWGVGGINIDGCRIEAKDQSKLDDNWDKRKSPAGFRDGEHTLYGKGETDDFSYRKTQGRFPANLILDDVAGELLDRQSGDCKTGNIKKGTLQGFGKGRNTYGEGCVPREYQTDIASGASRFFYCAKASKSEKNAHLRGEQLNNHPTVKAQKLMTYLCRLVTPPEGIVLDPFMGSGSTGIAAQAEKFRFIGCEAELEYLELAKARILSKE